MLTYQDLLEVTDNEEELMQFVQAVISQHKSSDLYETAKIADDYARHKNRTITEYQKLLYTVSGQAVPDNWSANYKLASNFFYRFVTQQNQYLLGNGVTWGEDSTEEKLGDDFDTKLQEAGKDALVHGVSFGFFNLDHVEVFSVLEFAPLYDEENGALAAGVRFWQIDSGKPLRATLYEQDGYTDYIWEQSKGSILKPKRAYKINVTYSEVDGEQIFDGENYPSLPIIPCWGNPYRQSELVGIREQIDAYDLIKSGFCDTVDEASMVYWTITNAGGMDDIDLAKFIQRMKTVRAAAVEDGEQVQAHSIDMPYQAREMVLDRIRRDLYRDYMALDTDEIAGGAVTATQIKAAYEPVNCKADQYEYCIIKFIKGILDVAGIEDDPSFTRSVIVNQAEELTNVLAAAQFLEADYVTRKVLDLLGDGDQADDIIQKRTENEIAMGLNRITVEEDEQT